jgi:hypothetical protein
MSAAIADKLDDARALIEKGWCQKDYAQDRCGSGIWYDDPQAVCYCAVGAIRAVCGEDEIADVAERTVEGVVGAASLISWNDKHTQAEVIEAFRKAAELARGEA